MGDHPQRAQVPPWGEFLLLSQLKLAGGGLDGPISGAKRAAHAGRDMILSIDMVQAEAQPKGNGRVFSRQGDKIAHAHGTIMQVALHGAV